MAHLRVPRIVVTVPRIFIVMAIATVAVYGSQLIKSQPKNQQIHTQSVSIKNTVPYTAAPQAIVQPVPVQTPKSVAIVPQVVAEVKVTHSATPTPVVTPAPSASVSGLSPVNPAGSTPSSSGSSGNSGSSTGSGSSSGSSSSSSPPPTTSGYTSENWSGYLMTTGKYTSVTGSWTVPKTTGTSGEVTADAAWIGIGGVSTGDLIQVGTQDTVSASGVVSSSAFYEMLPHSSRTINSLSISPGDTIGATLTETTTNEWTITITDTTTGKSYSLNVAYDSQLSSAEWIEEDPSYSAGRLVPLDNFSPVQFTNATAVDNGNTVNLSSGDAVPITLVTSTDTVVASPSSLDSGDEGFIVTKQS